MRCLREFCLSRFIRIPVSPLRIPLTWSHAAFLTTVKLFGTADAGRDGVREFLREPFLDGDDLRAGAPGDERPHAAGDVETDAARETTPPASASNAATPPIGKP